ncbi:MAG: DUF6378 domain-containing protein [Defluviicoccus sp.]
MNAAMLLQHAAGVIEKRERICGPAAENFATIAARWSLVLGITVTPAQVALCLIDLKLARLSRDPAHLDSIVDVAGYAACLREVSRCEPNPAARLSGTCRAPRRTTTSCSSCGGRRGANKGSWCCASTT